MAEESIGRRSPAALSVLVDLASEVSSSKKRLGKVITSPVDGFWRPDFAGAPHCEQCHCSSRKSERSASAPALARQPFCATDGPQTTLSSLSRSVAVASPVAGRDRAGRPSGRCGAREATCRGAARCCQTKQVPKKGVEGRRREARRRPKKVASVWLFGPVSALRNFSDSLLERRITIRPPLSTTP